MNCANITQGATYDCDNPVQAGLLPDVIVLNSDDILSFTFSGNTITDIIMKPGKKGYMFSGYRQSVSAEYTKKETALITGYEHSITLQIFDISSQQKRNLERLALGSMVAITFLIPAQGNADTFFEVYGVGANLEAASITRIAKDADTQGSITLNIKTPDESIETKLPYSFFDTDYDTTLAKIYSLLNAGDNVSFPYILPFVLS